MSLLHHHLQEFTNTLRDSERRVVELSLKLKEEGPLVSGSQQQQQQQHHHVEEGSAHALRSSNRNAVGITVGEGERADQLDHGASAAGTVAAVNKREWVRESSWAMVASASQQAAMAAAAGISDTSSNSSRASAGSGGFSSIPGDDLASSSTVGSAIISDFAQVSWSPPLPHQLSTTANATAGAGGGGGGHALTPPPPGPGEFKASVSSDSLLFISEVSEFVCDD